MQTNLEQYAHDLKRNVSSIFAGAALLQRRMTGGDSDKKNILSEMSNQCEATLEMLEKLFNELELKNKGEQK